MTQSWFVRWGWVHRPRSWQGVLTVVSALAFCVQVFLAVDAQSHSLSDTLYGVFPFILPTFLLVEWIASRSSQRGA